MSGSRFTAEELAAWHGFLRTHARVTRRLDAALSASHSLPLTHFDVLIQLSLAGGLLRMSELADRLLVSRSGLTRIIDQLEAQDLVVRERDAGDARGLNASLTPAGRARLSDAAGAHTVNVREAFLGALTSAEQASLAAGWRAIAERLDATEPPPARVAAAQALRRRQRRVA